MNASVFRIRVLLVSSVVLTACTTYLTNLPISETDQTTDPPITGSSRTDEPKPAASPINATPIQRDNQSSEHTTTITATGLENRLGPLVCNISDYDDCDSGSTTIIGDLDGDKQPDRTFSYMTRRPNGECSTSALAILHASGEPKCFHIVYDGDSGRGTHFERVLRTKTNGWHDVEIVFSGDGDNGIAHVWIKMRFDGSKYKWDSITDCPSLRNNPQTMAECESVFRSYRQ